MFNKLRRDEKIGGSLHTETVNIQLYSSTRKGRRATPANQKENETRSGVPGGSSPRRSLQAPGPEVSAGSDGPPAPPTR